MTVNYLEASQGALTVTARVVRAGKTVAYAEAEAVNEAMGLMAKVSATFRIIR
jgi:acyl-coenzyme A thioesterase PaaI-like protein